MYGTCMARSCPLLGKISQPTFGTRPHTVDSCCAVCRKYVYFLALCRLPQKQTHIRKEHVFECALQMLFKFRCLCSGNRSMQALKSFLNPRSHLGQHAAFPGMRISLLVWSSEIATWLHWLDSTGKHLKRVVSHASPNRYHDKSLRPIHKVRIWTSDAGS